MTAPGFRGGLLRGGIFGLWGEQVQGEGRGGGGGGAGGGGGGGGAAAPPAGSCVLQGLAEGQGPGRGGPGARALQGLAEGQGWGRQPRRPQGAGPGEARQPRRGGCRPVPHLPQACPLTAGLIIGGGGGTIGGR